jgi:hypothetical protein
MINDHESIICLIFPGFFSRPRYNAMGGGLMQLVAYGAQDIYLTGNPQITFFKVVYRRHTNFSMETIEQTISGSSIASGSGTVTISRNGDLVYKVYVTVDSATATASGGNTIIDNIELEIGGQKIDKQTTQWNQIWADLSTPESKTTGFRCMTGGCSNAQTYGVGQIQVPLNFWFCRNPGLALPLIALQYHEVKLKCVWGVTAGTRKVLCDYIYLDTDERRRFAQVSHEYLIEQIQEQSADTSGSFKLNFNHPVKELIWTSDADNTYATALLKLNGHDRFSAQQEEYFQLRQPMDYHTAVPGQNVVLTDRPQMLATPLDMTDVGQGIVIAHSGTPSTDQFCTVASGALIKIHAANNRAKVGDILLVDITKTDADAASSQCMHYQVLTTDGAANPTMSVSPTPIDSVPGFGSVQIIARVQDPLSRTGSLTKKVNVYSFALKPEEHQPSGTCNFSRIDNARLDIGLSTGMDADDTIYAVNYNVLRIMSGMGGLAYSN